MKTHLQKALLLALLCLLLPLAAQAAESVGITASYANPFTGKVEDSGSDAVLGQSMSESVLESQALYETADGRAYVTLRLHLADQIGAMAFDVADGDGHFKGARAEEVERGSDYVDMRLAVPGPAAVIRLHLDVVPMGRTVVFFGVLDGSGSAPSAAASAAPAAKGSASAKGTSAASAPAAKAAAKGQAKASPEAKSKDEAALGEADSTAALFGDEHGLLTKEDLDREAAAERPPLGPITKALIYAAIVLLTILTLLAVVAAAGAVIGLRFLRRANDRKEAMLYDREDLRNA